MERTLNFKSNRTELLTLDELRMTVDERSAGGKPPNGIRHIELMDSLIERLQKQAIPFKIESIIATDGGLGSMSGATYIEDLAKIHGERDIRTYILRRIMSIIRLTDEEDDISYGGIAISYHQQGIMLAYGQNIKICTNLAILGRENAMSTYGDQYDRVANIQHMLEVAEGWAVKHYDKRSRDLQILNAMRHTDVTTKEVEELIGFMNIIRVQKDVFHTRKEYPLNQSQINQFTQDYIRFVIEKEKATVYDIYSLGTEFHKPDRTDLPLVLPNNITFYDVLDEKFKISEQAGI